MHPIQTTAEPKEERSSRPRPEDRGTRAPMAGWDRCKIIILLLGVWLVLLWALKSDNPLITWGDAVRQQLHSASIWLILAGLEAVRQIHYLICEQSAPYNKFWKERVFGGWERRISKYDDWNRYRLGRALKWLTLLVLFAYLLGHIRHETPAAALFGLPTTIWKAMPMVIQIVLYMFVIVGQFALIFWFLSKGGVDVYMPDDINTRFTDVWGQDNVLERVQENMVFLENPEEIEARGGHVPTGILLWGPPGTGKTLMAEAVAGETGKPFVFVDPGAFQNMFMGVGILKVKSLFRKLRKLAVRYGGVIVFFDEADALGNRGAAVGGMGGMMTPSAVPGPWSHDPSCHGLAYSRPDTISFLHQVARAESGASAGDAPAPGGIRRFVMGGMGGGGGGMGTLQALLTELSGLKKPRGFMNRVVRRTLGFRQKPPPKYRILVMMATNMPESLDEALLRPGRIDRIYRVGYPSKEGRKRTYEGYLDKVRHEITPQQVDRMATITPYATGATIKDVVNEALIVAIRDGREVITWKDLIKARLMKTLGPPEDVEYIERERHAVAVHEACHAVTQFRMQKHIGIDIATIEKGQSYLGMVKPIPLEEQFSSWKSEDECEIMVFLASLAGERLFFDGDNSRGVSADLQAATSIAMYMEGYWGMGNAIGSHAAVKGPATAMQIVDGMSRDMLETALGRRVETRLAELYDRVSQLLEHDRKTVLAVAHALETHKTLTGEDVEAVILGTVGPIVDGGIYRDSTFVALLEAYHERAVAAHRNKAKIGLPLPAIAPVTVGTGVGLFASPSSGENGHGGGNGSAHGNGHGNGNGAGAHGPSNGASTGSAGNGESGDGTSDSGWPEPLGTWPEPPTDGWPSE